MNPVEEFNEAYLQGGATGNTISTIANLASLLAASASPSSTLPVAIFAGGEGASVLAKHKGLHDAIKEKMEEKGLDFNEKPTDAPAIARSMAGAFMASGLPLAHALLETSKAKKELTSKGLLKGLKPSTRNAAAFAHAFSKPKNIAMGVLAAIIGGNLAPHAARIAGGNPFEKKQLDTGEGHDEFVG